MSIMRFCLQLWEPITIWIHPKISSSEEYYDLEEDWELIEASFLKQYGIRLRNQEDMSYSEFCSLLSGIMPDTPLGQIVSIRVEKDPTVIANFTKAQKRIHKDWIIHRNRKLKQDPIRYKAYIDGLQNFARQFKN